MSGHRPPHGAQRVGFAGRLAQLHGRQLRHVAAARGMQVHPRQVLAVQLTGTLDQCLQGLVAVSATLRQHLLPGTAGGQQQYTAARLGQHEQEVPCSSCDQQRL